MKKIFLFVLAVALSSLSFSCSNESSGDTLKSLLSIKEQNDSNLVDVHVSLKKNTGVRTVAPSIYNDYMERFAFENLSITKVTFETESLFEPIVVENIPNDLNFKVPVGEYTVTVEGTYQDGKLTTSMKIKGISDTVQFSKDRENPVVVFLLPVFEGSGDFTYKINLSEGLNFSSKVELKFYVLIKAFDETAKEREFTNYGTCIYSSDKNCVANIDFKNKSAGLYLLEKIWFIDDSTENEIKGYIDIPDNLVVIMENIETEGECNVSDQNQIYDMELPETTPSE